MVSTQTIPERSRNLAIELGANDNNSRDVHNFQGIDTQGRRRALLDELYGGPTHTNSKILIYRYPPFFIIFISLFELIVFTYYSMRSEESISITGPIPFNSKLIFNPYRRYEVWRFFTYILIHAGYWHITFNILIQLAVGIPLETVHKTTPIFLIYIGGTIGGALASSVTDPHSYLAGASSGCYALISAHLSDLILNWRDLSKEENPFFKLLTLLVFCSSDLGIAIYERHFTNQSIAWRTSYGGHLAGFASGLLLGLVYLKRARVRTWDQHLAQVAKTVFIFLSVLAMLVNIFHPDHFPLPDHRAIIWSQSPFLRTRE